MRLFIVFFIIHSIALNGSEYHAKLLEDSIQQFEQLELYFEGDSRILKRTSDPRYLISKLKPTVFSYEIQGTIKLDDVDIYRTKLNAIFAQHLHSKGIHTSTLYTKDGYSLQAAEKVPNIEVVVKSAHIGSPKYLYTHMDQFQTRGKDRVIPGNKHAPYVRFDWRNPRPEKDVCLPEGLANRFIHTENAKETALMAFYSLQELLNRYHFDLLDICFFMNEEGKVICAEISTDNTKIDYTGTDSEVQAVFQRKDKSSAVEKARILSELIRPIEKRRIIISGPFCTGKTTLIQSLQNDLNIPKLIDDSSREMRPGERQDFPYHFINRDEFLTKLDAGKYYEWVEFNGNYYGVPVDKLKETEWIFDILSTQISHYNGKFDGMVSVYLEKPSDQVLIERARKRGDSEEKIRERLIAIQDEDSSQHDYLIPNVDLDKKVEIMRKIVQQDPDVEVYRNWKR